MPRGGGRIMAAPILPAALRPGSDRAGQRSRASTASRPPTGGRSVGSWVGAVDRPLTVEQDGEEGAGLFRPLPDGGQRAERDDEDAGVELLEFGLKRAQLWRDC